MGVESTAGGPISSHGPRCPCCGTPVPSARGDRRFTIVDGMILVAAAAVAFVVVRPLVDGPTANQPAWLLALATLIGGVVALTPTLLILRLRSPRPSLRHLSRQPGFAASLAGTAILSMALLATGLLALARTAKQAGLARGGPRSISPNPGWWVGVVVHFGAVVGPAVIGAWLLLAVGGRRRPSRGWLDPSGRILGVLWIALFVLYCCNRLTHLQG